MRTEIRYNNIIDSDEARLAQAAADKAPETPTPLVDRRKFYITQAYHKYTRDDHEVWRDLFNRRWGMLEQQVSRTFIDGLKILRLSADRLPLLSDTTVAQDCHVADGKIIKAGTRLEGINRYLGEVSDWASYGVPGYLPAKAFFACLAAREFPTTILIRPREVMDYLPEPDIFHDVFGHVPLHASRVFADFLQTYGKAALACDDPVDVERLGRLFWFTVEFGLIKEDGRVKIYGSGPGLQPCRERIRPHRLMAENQRARRRRQRAPLRPPVAPLRPRTASATRPSRSTTTSRRITYWRASSNSGMR